MALKIFFVFIFIRFSFAAEGEINSLARLAVKNPCIIIRGAMDLGSGTTKVKVAEINKCHKTIGRILYEKNVKVSYQADLDKSKDKSFSKNMLIEGEMAIKNVLLEVARQVTSHENIQWKSVTSAAFRNAKNSSEFVHELNLHYPINVRILNQVEEGILGFNSAFAYEPKPLKSVVWDIGGGSSQWVAESKGEFLFFLTQLASETFKELILKEFKKNTTTNTPNPFYREQRLIAEKIATQEAEKLNPQIKELLKNNAKVIGIGSVHFHSVLGQIHGLKNKNKMTYTIDQIETAIQGRMGHTDRQIGGDYATTEVSNLIYVCGFMKALGIKNVVVRKINLTDGLLLDI
ncbi:MAG: hypothetical protein QE271_10020 [Bacteriovoracaceae bacterium]|nr:hypothetical protein [Bacteriovoracaceae bacterium]